VTYFPQHYLNSSIDKQGTANKEVNKLIRTVLSQNEKYSKAFEDYRTGLQKLDEGIAAAATSFENALRDLREQRHHSGEKGKSADIQANIDRLQAEFNDLQRRYNLSEREIADHAELSLARASLIGDMERL
jgi:predicted  nucleic acid-binding Zn-ribbon protein